MELSQKEIIELSKQDPQGIYTSDDGQVVFNGMIFKNKEEFEKYIKLSLNPPLFLRLIYKTHNLFAKKKNKIDISVYKKRN